MRIDLTCPIEMWHCKMPTPSDPMLMMELYNLSEKPVASIQICVLCYDARGVKYARHVERIQELNAPVGHAFEAAAAVEEAAQAQDLEVVFQKVWFEDGTVWRRGAAEPAEYAPPRQLSGSQLAVLQELAGKDASSYPSDQGAVWVCVCGRPNAARESQCRRCHRNKHQIFTQFNEAAVEKILFYRQSVLEDTQRQRREEQRQAAIAQETRNRRRRKRRRIILASVLCVLAAAILGFGVYFHGLPYYRYYMANRALESGQYETAKAQFQELAAQQGKRSLPIRIDAIGLDIDLMDMRLYYDSASMAQECDYRAALSALQGGTYTSLRTAQSEFEALGDYKDSAQRSKEARYVYAEKLMAANNWADAVSLLSQISDYGDAQQKQAQATYEWANALMADGNYTDAREKYLSLGEYESAASRAQECLYQTAAASLNDGNPLSAIDALLQLGTYRDSALLLQRAYYTAGDASYNAQDYNAAAEYFLQAGNYSDAYRRAAGCLYTPAVAAMEVGEYALAADMFEKITGYQDAKALLAQCRAMQGNALLEQGDYEGAAAYFDLAPDLVAAQEGRKEAIYRPAQEALNSGDMETALSLFRSIPGYKDADSFVSQILYDQALEQLNAKDYASSIETLQALNGYGDSAKDLASAQYAQAVGFIDSAEYEAAIEQLAALGDYEDAPEYLAKARYLLALDKKANGDYDSAMTIFSVLGDYEDATTQYQGCVYALALQKAEGGDVAGAIQALSDIPTYQDAAQRVKALAYDAGKTALDEGDLASATAYFAQAGDYQDAPAMVQRVEDEYFAQAYATAAAAMVAKDYGAAADLLIPLTKDHLSEKYAELPALYREACYQRAVELYAAGKHFDALRYFKEVPTYKDVETNWLQRPVYLLMGSWKSGKGLTLEFREDGTCTIDGKDYYYKVPNKYSINLGEDPDNTVYAYNILDQGRNKLNLRDVKNDTVHYFSRPQEE